MAKQAPVPEVEDDGMLPPPSGGGKGSNLRLILATALVVGPVAVGGFAFMSKKQALAAPKAGHAAAAETTDEKAEHGSAAEDDAAEYEDATFSLPSRTINLADGDRYARCQVVLLFKLPPVDAEYFQHWAASYANKDDMPPGGDAEGGGHGGGKKKGKAEEPSAKVEKLVYNLWKSQALLHDATIRELGSRQYDELLNESDKDQLTKALRARYNRILSGSDEPVQKVLFSEFIMQ